MSILSKEKDISNDIILIHLFFSLFFFLSLSLSLKKEYIESATKCSRKAAENDQSCATKVILTHVADDDTVAIINMAFVTGIAQDAGSMCCANSAVHCDVSAPTHNPNAGAGAHGV